MVLSASTFCCILPLMELHFTQYIQNLLRGAHYEYDPSVKDWVGWIADYPGVYAQGRTVEDVRADLISILEDFLVMDLQAGKRVLGLSVLPRTARTKHRVPRYAAAHKS